MLDSSVPCGPDKQIDIFWTRYQKQVVYIGFPISYTEKMGVRTTECNSERIYLSVITIGEIQKGIEKLPNSKRKAKLQEWLQDGLLIRFKGRIASIDMDIALVWGQLIGRLESSGKKMSAMDSLIAAIVLYGNFTLVTRNEDDFKYTGIQIFNPWKASF